MFLIVQITMDQRWAGAEPWSIQKTMKSVQCLQEQDDWQIQTGSCNGSQYLKIAFHPLMLQRAVDARVCKDWASPLSWTEDAA